MLDDHHVEQQLSPFSAPYDETSMRWWRIRNADGMTHWELSADGETWSSRAANSGFVGLENVMIQILTLSTAQDEDVARFDNVNL